MKTIHISEILVEDRQRSYFDEGRLIDLAESIETVGLIHAPALQEGTNKLIAGGRRLKALEILMNTGKQVMYEGKILPPGLIPYTHVRAEDVIQLKEAELTENLMREDLTWQERARAEAELHNLRKEQSPTKEQPIRETARELKGGEEPAPQDITRTRENLFLAEQLNDPTIAKVKDRKTALRLAREKVIAEKRKAFQTQFNVKEQKESIHRMIQGNALDVLPTLSGIDLILTDPPYGMDAGEFGSQFTIQHNYKDDSEGWDQMMFDFMGKAYAACKPDAYMFLFCSIDKWGDLVNFANEAGWLPWARPLIWDKGSLGSLPHPKYGPRYCYEAILFARKGKREVLKNGRDILPFPTGEKTYHAAEKPVLLYKELIERICEAGDIVCDPFAGSGTIFPAATSCSVKAIGIEIMEEYCLIARERM